MAKIWPVLFSFLLIACGSDSSVETFRAPSEQDQAGIITRCLDREEVLTLAETHGGKFRELSKKKRLYEVFGVEEYEIKAAYQKARTKKNIVKNFFKSQNVQINPVEAYAGAKVREEFDPTSFDFFPHLKQIGKDQVGNSNWGEGVVIAILDTGVSYNHPHLSPNIYLNEADKHGVESDGVDNDQNNYVDDYVGYDFINHDPYPLDDHGHGTHVAGLAAGTISGSAPRAKILPVKVLSGEGYGDLGSIVAGIVYAVDRGAHIINLSLGGEGNPLAPELAELVSSLKLASSKGVLIMAAAGNGGFDGAGDCNDEQPIYPGNVDAATIVAVAAVDAGGSLTTYSNYGPKTVDIASPGGTQFQGLKSTAIWIEDSHSVADYTFMAGTSMATPVAAGVAATLMSDFSDEKALEIKEKLFDNGLYNQELEGRILHPRIVHY